MEKAEYEAQLAQNVAELYRILEAAREQAEGLLDMVALEQAALDTFAAAALPDVSFFGKASPNGDGSIEQMFDKNQETVAAQGFPACV